MKFLIIEDDIDTSNLVQHGLSSFGHSDVIRDGSIALNQVLRDHYALIVLDINLPGLDGFSFVEKLRAAGNQTPVLILSGRGEAEDRIRGLQLGGDDYITKPFAMPELLLRVRNLLKRQQVAEISIQYADVSLNRITREVTRAGKKLELQEREFVLLDLLLSHPNKIIGKNEILKQVWNYDFDPQTNVVDVLVCRLRNKLEKDFPSRLIYTVRGVGYVLKAS